MNRSLFGALVFVVGLFVIAGGAWLSDWNGEGGAVTLSGGMLAVVGVVVVAYDTKPTRRAG